MDLTLFPIHPLGLPLATVRASRYVFVRLGRLRLPVRLGNRYFRLSGSDGRLPLSAPGGQGSNLPFFLHVAVRRRVGWRAEHKLVRCCVDTHSYQRRRCVLLIRSIPEAVVCLWSCMIPLTLSSKPTTPTHLMPLSQTIAHPTYLSILDMNRLSVCRTAQTPRESYWF